VQLGAADAQLFYHGFSNLGCVLPQQLSALVAGLVQSTRGRLPQDNGNKQNDPC
jgi:hypothetical protein